MTIFLQREYDLSNPGGEAAAGPAWRVPCGPLFTLDGRIVDSFRPIVGIDSYEIVCGAEQEIVRALWGHRERFAYMLGQLSIRDETEEGWYRPTVKATLDDRLITGIRRLGNDRLAPYPRFEVELYTGQLIEIANAQAVYFYGFLQMEIDDGN